jgi:UDP-N-acetylmuramate: L-alanyl-gamma-D-glutamyl-meso-diaminopimelate ligase
MAALAGLLTDAGCRVTGSDRALYPPTSTLLDELGLEVHVGFHQAHLDPAPDLVVIGNAISRGNPEVEDVLDRNLRYTSMPRLLEERFLDRRHSIVIAGTHGKTTMTSMLAWILHRAGRDPGFLVGGIPANFERSYRLGTGPAFVIEGDEYDSAFFDKGPKFMHYRPDTAIVGTVEFDHADIYRDLDHVKTVFRWFANLVPGRGLIVRHEDCAVTREVTAGALCRVEGFGTEAGDWRVEDLRVQDNGTAFRILRAGRHFLDTRIALDGGHNVRNAVAAAAAAAEQGLDATEIGDGLASFLGVRRRLEVRGEADGVVVLDDFAHHPTAIGETIRALRRRYAGRRLWAVVEPRSWSMRRNVFQDRLVAAFEGADEIVIAAVFDPERIPEDQRLDPDRLVAALARSGLSARFLPGADAILEHLSGQTRSGDVVAVMSNGGFDALHDRLLDALRARAAATGA